MNIDKLFALKQPCSQCPFLKEGGVELRDGRIEEIVESLNNDAPFFCHKTIDYEQETKQEQVDDAMYCAGSMIYLEKYDGRNVPMRLGMKFGLYDPEQLKGHDEVIDKTREDV